MAENFGKKVLNSFIRIPGPEPTSNTDDILLFFKKSNISEKPKIASDRKKSQ